MTDETIRTFITSGATVGAVVITQFFTFLNLRSNKNDSIYKQQYDKIFSPIHRILFFDSQSKSENLEEICAIISNNYSLASDALIEEFKICFDNDEITEEFSDMILSAYNLLKNKLGYSKLKMKKDEKRKSLQTIITDSSKAKLTKAISEIMDDFASYLELFGLFIVFILFIMIIILN